MKVLLITPIALVDEANAAAIEAAGQDATGTFAPNCAKDSDVATHCVACWDMTTVQLNKFREAADGLDIEILENSSRRELINLGYRIL
jgi:hypothetical protein